MRGECKGGSWVRFPARVGSILEDILTLVLYLKTAFFSMFDQLHFFVIHIYQSRIFFHFREGGRCRSQTPQDFLGGDGGGNGLASLCAMPNFFFRVNNPSQILKIYSYRQL